MSSQTLSTSIFQKNLQDLVKGIRLNKKDSGAFISEAIQSIKEELRDTDPFIKAEAVSICLGFLKLYWIFSLGTKVNLPSIDWL